MSLPSRNILVSLEARVFFYDFFHRQDFLFKMKSSEVMIEYDRKSTAYL